MVSLRPLNQMPAAITMTKIARTTASKIGPTLPAPIAEPSGPQTTVAAPLSHSMSPSANAMHARVQRFSDGDICPMSKRRCRGVTGKRRRLATGTSQTARITTPMAGAIPGGGVLCMGARAGGAAPARHRHEPDHAGEGGETGAAEAVDEAFHAGAGYLRARYCSNVMVPSRCSGQSNRPSAHARLNLKGSHKLMSRLLGLRILSHEVARLLKSLTSGPPKSGSMPAGSAVTISINRAATSVVSTGWNRHLNGTVARPGSLLMASRNRSIRVWNWVERWIDQGTIFSRTTASAASLLL